MNLTGLLRVIFRWKTAAKYTFFALLALSLGVAVLRSPRYESQVMVERKPVRITPVVAKQDDERFDVYRLTSESQWSMALLKSRFIMERWVEAIGLPAPTPVDKEKQLQRLAHSLTVQPVSYTDVFVVKVRALSPEEANRRAGLLVDVFAKWDLEKNRQQAQELLDLLQQRINQVSRDLSDEWARLKRQKDTQSLSLSGSSATRQLDLDIRTKEKLFDMLTTELEEAERQLNTDRIPRSRPLNPPSLPGEPVMSRFQTFVLGLCMSLLGALAMVFLLEWQDPSIRRTQDIMRAVPTGAVLSIPPLERGDELIKNSPLYLGPLSDAISKLVQDKGSAVVQFASASEGDGKTTMSASLARMLSPNHKVCLVHRVRSTHVSEGPAPLIKATGDYTAVDIDMTEPLSKHLMDLKRSFNLVLIDTDTVPDSPPGSNLAADAEMACVLVSAGRTSRQFFRAFQTQLKNMPDQQVVFILNRYEDPLLPWFQPTDIRFIPAQLRRFF